MPYRIVLTKSAIKELDDLPLKTHDQVVGHLRELEENPRVFGSEKLTAINAYKLRVVMGDDRKQVYKKLRRKK